MVETGSWYFDVTSDLYGNESFGPYDTEDEAHASAHRHKKNAVMLHDKVERSYSLPYQRSFDIKAFREFHISVERQDDDDYEAYRVYDHTPLSDAAYDFIRYEGDT